MLIRDSRLDTSACTHEGSALVVAPTPTMAGCGHCGEVVYPAAEVIAEHDFTCDGDVVRWWSRAMQIEVHRCGEDVTAFDEISIEELTHGRDQILVVH